MTSRYFWGSSRNISARQAHVRARAATLPGYLPTMDSDARYLDAATWVRVWQAAAPRLEAIRLKELHHTTVAEFVESMSDAYRAALLHGEPRLTSGLVEQQRLFAKLGV